MSARLDDALYEEILEYAREKGMSKTKALKELAKEGVRTWRLSKALALYKEGKITFGGRHVLLEFPFLRWWRSLLPRKFPYIFQQRI